MANNFLPCILNQACDGLLTENHIPENNLKRIIGGSNFGVRQVASYVQG